MYDRWARAAGSSKVSGVVLLDLSAAFDLVDPAILIQKLRIYGVEEDFLCWISSYLTNRYQAVWMDHILSEFLHSEIGVPQGSNLGPLLFLIYFNDLPYTLEGEIDSYADDTTMTMAGDSVEEIGRKLTEDCRRVSEWMTQNKLKLNPDKTHILTVGTEQKLRTLANPV
jgi:ribonuclease P/MRP protein subunit RPP40